MSRAGDAADGQQLVWLAGTDFDALPGTDHRLVHAMRSLRQVLWVDPPRHFRSLTALPGRVLVENTDPGFARVSVTGPPFLTRPGVRVLTAGLAQRSARRAVRAGGPSRTAVVNAFPLATFPARMATSRVLYCTDDWLQGAPLMGLSRRHVGRVLRANLRSATGVAAVSPELIDRLRSFAARFSVRLPPTLVLPNGASNAIPHRAAGERQPLACLVGQLNERLDLSALEAVIDAGVPIRVIGPRTERDPTFARRLSRFLALPGVEYLGARASQDLPRLTSDAAVGLTPYRVDDEFNRASSPLKTLEYLSWGLPVVSTDLPAARWLGTEHLAIAQDAQDFAHQTKLVMGSRRDTGADQSRLELARAHSWARRAEALSAFIEQVRQ